MKYLRFAVVGWVVLVACSGSGESNDDASADGGGSGEIGCGELTCSADQICVIHQSGPFQSGEPDAYACEAGPVGCDIDRLCDCPGSDGLWGGLPITGCSILGGRSLWVTDTSCGEESPCSEQQACVLVGSPLGEVSGQHCAALPAGCEVSMDFCDTDCAERIATADGKELNGCSGADWAVGVYVKE